MPKAGKRASIQSTNSSMLRASIAWSAEDDELLMQKRSQGLTWQPISKKHFPDKTPNACRKRHERLMERRNVQDWDGHKLELLAKLYMETRKDIWMPLASAMDERWTFIEEKCMEKGIKTLAAVARNAIRRDKASGTEDLADDTDSGIAMDDDTEVESGTAGHNEAENIPGPSTRSSAKAAAASAASASSTTAAAVALAQISATPSHGLYQYHTPVSLPPIRTTDARVAYSGPRRSMHRPSIASMLSPMEEDYIDPALQ